MYHTIANNLILNLRIRRLLFYHENAIDGRQLAVPVDENSDKKKKINKKYVKVK